MQSRFLRSGSEVLQELVTLAQAADRWSFCASRGVFAESSECWRALEPHLPKLKYAIVGLDLHRSEPWLLGHLHDLGVLRIVATADATFGPNIYLFNCGDEFHAIVGSVALDGTALESPFQAAVCTSCHFQSQFALAVEEFFDRCRREAQLPTMADLENYSQAFANFAPTLERAKTFHLRRRPENDDVDGPDDVDDRDVPQTERKPQPDVDEAEPVDNDNDEESQAEDDSLESRLLPEDLETNEVMAEIRIALRSSGDLTQDELLREVAKRFGFHRLGKKIERILKGHLRAAIRRRIVARSVDGNLIPDTREITEYSRDELVKSLLAGVRPGRWYERNEAIHAAANYLGFSRRVENVREAFKSAINSAIRQRKVEADGSAIRRSGN